MLFILSKVYPGERDDESGSQKCDWLAMLLVVVRVLEYLGAYSDIERYQRWLRTEYMKWKEDAQQVSTKVGERCLLTGSLGTKYKIGWTEVRF